MPLLEKARGELPAKAPPPKKKAAEAAPRPVSTVYDDEEEESRPTTPKKAEAKSEKVDLKTKALGKSRGKVGTRMMKTVFLAVFKKLGKLWES